MLREEPQCNPVILQPVTEGASADHVVAGVSQLIAKCAGRQPRTGSARRFLHGTGQRASPILNSVNQADRGFLSQAARCRNPDFVALGLHQIQRTEVAGFRDAEDAHDVQLAHGTAVLVFELVAGVLKTELFGRSDLQAGGAAAACALEPAAACSAAPRPELDDLLKRDSGMLELEREFLEEVRDEVSKRAAEAPVDAAGFVRWFEDLAETGPGQNDPLFSWLAEHADIQQMRWYLEQEAAGEAGFDDLPAYTQVKLPSGSSSNCNYWDEMGRGNARGMHGPMLQRLVEALQLKPKIETTAWRAWRWRTQ